MSQSIEQLAKESRAASVQIAALDSARKDALLYRIAENLIEAEDEILRANETDIKKALENGLSDAMVDRLRLSRERLEDIANAVREVAGQADPVGTIREMIRRPNGIQVGRMRIPLGVVAMIYESRPNVTIDAAVLCLKAGNAVFLRGGSEAFESNQAFAAVLKRSLKQQGLPEAAVSLPPDTDRAHVQTLLQQEEYIDLVIPRGGEGLIRHVVQNSRIPVIKHYKGVCHLYADRDADLEKAVALAVNGKTTRPGTCNSLETILIHEDLAEQLLPTLCSQLADKKVEIRACEKTRAIWPDALQASEEDYTAEFLSLIVSIRVVDSYEQAVSHIQQYGSDHTEVIVTEKLATAQRFLRDINSSVVMVNASSRFSDGGQLGLGAEIGISTSKLHAYGPMGVESLTTEKFIVIGDGQIRS